MGDDAKVIFCEKITDVKVVTAIMFVNTIVMAPSHVWDCNGLVIDVLRDTDKPSRQRWTTVDKDSLRALQINKRTHTYGPDTLTVWLGKLQVAEDCVLQNYKCNCTLIILCTCTHHAKKHSSLTNPQNPTDLSTPHSPPK